MRTRKRWLALCVCLLTIFACTSGALAAGREFFDGDYGFQLIPGDSGKAKIVRYTGSETDLVIPETLAGRKVVEIDKGVFTEDMDLVTVKIPDTVEKIGAGCFMKCENLKRVEWPDTIVNIDSNMFFKCVSLEGFTVPDTVISINDHAFAGCTGIKEFILPVSVQILGDGALSYTSVTEIDIPLNGVRHLPKDVFAGCASLAKISLPRTVGSIADDAFRGCADFIIVTAKNTNAERYALKQGILTMRPEAKPEGRGDMIP